LSLSRSITENVYRDRKNFHREIITIFTANSNPAVISEVPSTECVDAAKLSPTSLGTGQVLSAV
jgi:hypothetical protein